MRRGETALLWWGALQGHFGQCNQLVLLCSEFHNRCRQPGEPLCILASNIECLYKWAYDNMSPAVQSELGRDQFLHSVLKRDALSAFLPIIVRV